MSPANGPARAARSLEITCQDLTKSYGDRSVVRNLTFTVPAGMVTGFIGANGAGKTTTIRMLLGLVAPTAGEALIGGQRYVDLAEPRRVVGALLDGPGAHPRHTGRAHLEILARAAGAARHRVDEVLEMVDLAADAHHRVGRYSLGMRQRLGLAAALLGDPPVLILDEPANGLDPHGIRWLRSFLRDLADEGRTLLVSSHQLGELADTADRVVVIGRGRLLAESAVAELTGGAAVVEVTSPALDQLRPLLVASGGRVEADGDSRAVVHGLTAERIGALAADAGVPVHGLTTVSRRLEDVFLDLADAVAERPSDHLDQVRGPAAEESVSRP